MNKLILIIASIQLYLLAVKQANELNIKTIIKSLAISLGFKIKFEYHQFNHVKKFTASKKNHKSGAL